MKKQLLMKISAFFVTTMMLSASANAQIVNIPDAIFKSRLVNNLAINTNGDGEIQVTEATAFNGFMNVATSLGTTIGDLTGIEAFPAITGLNCSYNSFSSLDLSSNTSLTVVQCHQCIQLTSLNISANTALDTLILGNIGLTSLDVSSNSALTYLVCTYSDFTSLDVSSNSALAYLDCRANDLTSLDVSANSALAYLKCGSNDLTSLDVSSNSALAYLDCRDNDLTSLDVSSNTALAYLNSIFSDLTNLNIQNGNNANLFLDVTGSPSLTCIQVDNVANANSYSGFTFFKDAATSYSTNCGVTSVPDISNLSTMQIFPNPANNHLTIALGNNNKKVEVNITDITGKIIYSTTASETQKLEVNTADFKAGIYVVQIQSEEFIGTKKFIVTK